MTTLQRLKTKIISEFRPSNSIFRRAMANEMLQMLDECEAEERAENPKDPIKQIAKMISSGEIPCEVYNKYLSQTPIGFMSYEDLEKHLREW